MVIDCRFDLTDPALGEQQYSRGHIPGARYVHLDRDLSGEKTGSNGRHPLPTPEQMSERFGALGIGPSTQVVAYDADTGMYAARLWWMLRSWATRPWRSSTAGSRNGWRRAATCSRAGSPRRPTTFAAAPHDDWRLTRRSGGRQVDSLLVDARSPERFRGINETLDKVGGHIPGACNYFFQQNLTGDKTSSRRTSCAPSGRACCRGGTRRTW